MTRLILAGLTLLLVGILARGAEETAIGRRLESLSMKDFRGKAHKLADFKGQKLLVITFVGVECPLAKLYGPKLARLAKDYEAKGVAFIAVDANSQDGVTQLAAWARTHGINFPVLKDLGNELADKLGATRTPEVFLLDERRIVRYHGRIDDQYGIGIVRDAPKTNDLQTALDALLAGKEVTKAETPVTGCLIGRVMVPKADATVTFSKHVAPIFHARCVECHRSGDIGPFSLISYKDAAGWAGMIREVIDEGRMPPWNADPKHGTFANARQLSQAEKATIRAWVDAGAPEGNPADLPKPPRFITGWQLPREPDLVVAIREQPVKVAAQGPVKYQYFIVDPGFKEDKWASAVELAPGNRAVVHHILAFVLPPKVKPEAALDGTRSYLAAYVPGLRALPYPVGMAKKLPAGCKLVFQVHYTPNGTEQTDLSRIAFLFTDPAKLTHEVKTTSAMTNKIRIPPGAANYEIEATTTLTASDCQLLGFLPHMHLRGKAFSYEAIYPDGKKEILLDVPRYDFNWQSIYRYAQPLKLPAGTKVHCVAHFDNSENNPHNPNPKATVRWGDQTWDEMMIGYMDIALPLVKGKSVEITDPEKAISLPPGGYPIPERYKKALARYDLDGNGKLSEKEIEAMPDALRRKVREYILNDGE